MTLYLDVCAGISAFSVATAPLGWQCVGYSEIEKFPRAVLSERFGAVPVGWDHRFAPGLNYPPLFGDFTQIEAHHVGPIDLLCGGTPCQDFSIAGLRKGLDGERGNLTLEYLRLADRLRPRWLVWENVPGVLSIDGGRAFGAFLGGLGQLGYGFAYRVLDAQFVRVDGHGRAVPQRRKRVFVVGHLGDWRRAAAVLFDAESLRGNPPPRREAGQGTSCDVAPSLVSSGRGVERTGETRGQDPAVAVCSNSGDVGYCLTASAQQSLDAETETLLAVSHALRGEGFDVSEDGTGRGTPIVRALAFPERMSGTAVAATENVSPALGSVNPTAIVFDTTQITSAGNFSNPKLGDPCHPLAAGAHPPAVDFDLRGREGGAQFEGPHHTANIRAASGGSSRSYVAQEWAVRRLTPTECHRLMGFPDGHCAITWRGKLAADGPQYKALGNSMAVNVMRRIARRIEFVEAIMVEQEQAA
jgi:DNA (cytosine-5)-methyltransferase 1